MDRRAHRLSWALALVLAVAACAHASRRGGRPGSPCGAEIRGSERVTAPWTITLVGEPHGTVEAPVAFARLVCRAAERSHPHGVLVGLEIPRGDQAAIDAAMVATDDVDARARLLATTHFADESTDGRASLAMLGLLLELRRQRRAGFVIDVVAFDLDAATMTETTDRDAAMAAHLEAAIAAHPEGTTLVYVGNAHTRLRGAAGEREPPMAARLVGEHSELIALTAIGATGSTAYDCEGADLATLECRERPLAGGVDRGTEPFVELGDPGGGYYDGVLYVGGPMHASPPATRR